MLCAVPCIPKGLDFVTISKLTSDCVCGLQGAAAEDEEADGRPNSEHSRKRARTASPDRKPDIRMDIG
jgi:hypothetical protein